MVRANADARLSASASAPVSPPPRTLHHARRWAIQKAVEELTSLGLVGFFVWIFVFVYYLVASIIAPLIMLACCFPACRQSAVSIGAAAGEIKVSLTSPADTGGLSMRDFAVDVINVVRKAQEENKAKLRAAELKLSASGAAK